MLDRLPKISGVFKYARLVSARRKLNTIRPFTIARHTIQLPPGHLLDCYKISHPKYDAHLQHIGGILQKKYPDVWAVDVGANVGDSAAAISATSDINTVCIEGDPSYVELLTSNAARIGEFVHVVNAYVGEATGRFDPRLIRREGGTASIAGSLALDSIGSDTDGVAIAPLSTLLAPYGKKNFKFVKIDTDGFDFQILESCDAWLRQLRPVVLFECDTSFPSCDRENACRSIRNLAAAGYSCFIPLDNYGNAIQVSGEPVAFLERLIGSLENWRREARGTKYLDIYAFHKDDSDLYRIAADVLR